MIVYTDQRFIVDLLSAALAVPLPPRQRADAWGDRMRSELLRILKGARFAVATDVPYPPPASGLTLDIAATAETQPPHLYAIDLVTEGSDGLIMKGLQSAVDRLAQYPAPARRWVVGLSFSPAARQAFSTYTTRAEGRALWGEDVANGAGAIVITVPDRPTPVPPDPPVPPVPPHSQKEGSFMPGLLAPTQGLFMWNPPSAAGSLGLAGDVVRDYGASGSEATIKGSIAAGSSLLTLATPLDFRLEQGIVVPGAGPQGALLVTTVLGGAGTSRLILAEAATTTVTGAVVQHEDSWAWQAAIDATVAPALITCPPGSQMNLAAPLRLKSGVVLSFPASTLTWIGPANGAIFTSTEGQRLYGSGIVGGTVNPGAAGRVIDLHCPQECLIDLEVLDGAETLTVMRWATEVVGDSPPGPQGARGNVVRRLTAGKCGTLLALAGQEGAAVTRNLFQRLEGRECCKAGIVCEQSGYVDTNVFLETGLTLTADSGVGVDMGMVDKAPEIRNLLFVALAVSNPGPNTGCTGLHLRHASQVQVLSYQHTGFTPSTAVNNGGSASLYIRDVGLEGSDRLMRDSTRGWSVTPLQIGETGTPVKLHKSTYVKLNLNEPVPPLIPATPPPEPAHQTTATVTVDGALPGDTAVATPGTVVPGLFWNCTVSAADTVTISLLNVTQKQIIIPDTQLWRIDVWQHCDTKRRGGEGTGSF